MCEQGWEAELDAKLAEHAGALVGESGLDRAARVPGTKCSTCLQHQLGILHTHLRLTRKHGRPVSLHCVRADGAMHDALASLQASLQSGGAASSESPPLRGIMLHSFQGSPEMVARVVRIGAGAAVSVGSAVYFSVSCGGPPAGRSRDKLLARIQAMPDDRILTESDSLRVCEIDSALALSVGVISEAKGWTLQEAVDRTWANYQRFFKGFLPENAEGSSVTQT